MIMYIYIYARTICIHTYTYIDNSRPTVIPQEMPWHQPQQPAVVVFNAFSWCWWAVQCPAAWNDHVETNPTSSNLILIIPFYGWKWTISEIKDFEVCCANVRFHQTWVTFHQTLQVAKPLENWKEWPSRMAGWAKLFLRIASPMAARMPTMKLWNSSVCFFSWPCSSWQRA